MLLREKSGDACFSYTVRDDVSCQAVLEKLREFGADQHEKSALIQIKQCTGPLLIKQLMQVTTGRQWRECNNGQGKLVKFVCQAEQ